MKDFIGSYIINNSWFWILLLGIVLFIIFYKELKRNNNISKSLNRLDKDTYIVLNNVSINTTRKVHKLDTVVLSKFGIFIVKYVDYDGKIYGDDREANWIQLKDNKKNYFSNPSRQLHSNVRVIAELLDLNESYFIPIVCFLKESILSIDTKDRVTQVEFLDDVIKSYKKVIIKYGLNEIKDKILSGSVEDKSDVRNENICPRCGAKLVVRKGKYGDFIGCSNYPNCKFSREI